MRIILFLTAALFVSFIHAQRLSGTKLLEKAINYHDPDGNWKNFSGKIQITMKTPNSSERISKVQIDLPISKDIQ